MRPIVGGGAEERPEIGSCRIEEANPSTNYSGSTGPVHWSAGATKTVLKKIAPIDLTTGSGAPIGLFTFGAFSGYPSTASFGVKFITADFDPATVTWNTKPTSVAASQNLWINEFIRASTQMVLVTPYSRMSWFFVQRLLIYGIEFYADDTGARLSLASITDLIVYG